MLRIMTYNTLSGGFDGEEAGHASDHYPILCEIE
jgi:endonuclease/exonuclease/phosphatase family metal-dependent hydrolase